MILTGIKNSNFVSCCDSRTTATVFFLNFMKGGNHSTIQRIQVSELIGGSNIN